MSRQSFSEIYARAASRHGGADEVESQLPQPLSAKRLRSLGDDRLLSQMAKCVFRAGFVWQVVEAKWPGFEEAFLGFDPQAVASMSDRDLGALSEDRRIIRNPIKIRSVRDNATFVVDTAEVHGSFGRFVADWPASDIVSLWDLLKKEGQRLGGNTGPMFLREVGKDTFMTRPDVVGCLVDQGIVSKTPTGKRDLQATQEAFNSWMEESGRPLCQISRVLSMSWGEVH